MQMGRKSAFTAAQKRDAVMGVISKRNTESETCWELGILRNTTIAWWREQALEGMEARSRTRAAGTLARTCWPGSWR
jgi:transposase-like protein